MTLLTPLSTINRPGRSALNYRIGTFYTFYQTMLSRLSSEDFPALAALAARTPDDPAIALLDGWSAVLDVLTFYQERIANEGYLRTAVERASVLQMGLLTGYKLGPGVAASVYLAYTMDKGKSVTIATGSRAQSMAAQGSLPESFETSTDLDASDTHNSLGIRKTQPSLLSSDTSAIYVAGTANNLKANDVLVLVANAVPSTRRIAAVELQPQQNQTKITLQPVSAPPVSSASLVAASGLTHAGVTAFGMTDSGAPAGMTASAPPSAPPPSPSTNGSLLEPPSPPTFTQLMTLLAPLLKPPAAHPPNSEQLVRSVSTSFTPQSDNTPALLKTLYPALEPSLDIAFRNAPVSAAMATEAYVLRAKAGPFGSNAPLQFVAPSVQTGGTGTYKEWDLQRTVGGGGETFALDAQVTPQYYNQAAATVGFTVSLGQKTFTEPSGIVNQNAPVTINFPDANETIVVSISTSTDGSSSVIVTLAFQKRGATVNLGGQGLSISATGMSLKSASVSGGNPIYRFVLAGSVASAGTSQPTEAADVLWLDASHDQIQPGTWVVLDGAKTLIAKANQVAVASRADYGIVGRVTRIKLDQNWIDPTKDTFTSIRNASVYAQSEPLTLREETIDDPVSGQSLELDDLYTGLESGRWLIVQGERIDLPGVTAAELVMLAGVDQDVRKDSGGTPLSGEKVHSFLNLTNALSYQYRRDSVAILANVAHATHGEARSEVVGSADASQPLQTVVLHQKPLTYVSAPSASGNQSTLSVHVNNVLWTEAPDLLEMGPTDRKYLTMTDDSGTTRIIFGDGNHGLRPPTGTENIKADYRSGIGVGGNVDGGAITLLATRPMGVRSVINPLPSSGGADPETRDQARQNIPFGLGALDRLVSVQDYQDFARSFAGVAKCSVKLMAGRRPLVYLTIAGADGFPVDPSSDLYVNLTTALLNLGDPNFPVQVASCDLMLILVSANVAILPEYLWEAVKPAIRAALLDRLAFANRDLAQDVLASEVIAAIQSVEGVRYVDLQNLATVPRNFSAADLDALKTQSAPDRITVNDARYGSKASILPAQIAFLSPDITDLLILNKIKQ